MEDNGSVILRKIACAACAVALGHLVHFGTYTVPVPDFPALAAASQPATDTQLAAVQSPNSFDSEGPLRTVDLISYNASIGPTGNPGPTQWIYPASIT